MKTERDKLQVALDEEDIRLQYGVLLADSLEVLIAEIIQGGAQIHIVVRQQWLESYRPELKVEVAFQK